MSVPHPETSPLPRQRPDVGKSRPPRPGDLPVPRPAPAYSTDGTRLRDPAPDCAEADAICIRLSHRIADTCTAIETLARANALPPGFFARLIWRESLFDPYAISPAGALGIAQFMPTTARLRGLDDPFNPAAALAASARYLSELTRKFGNLGLAAAAYNAGEDRAARFKRGQSGLPGETRAYVMGITGLSATAWRDQPPAQIDLRLPGDSDFFTACLTHATNRTLPQFPSAPALQPWAVIIAAHGDRDVTAARYRVAAQRNPILKQHRPTIARLKLSEMRQAQYIAQIGRPTRADAIRLCQDVKRHGAVCTVMRN